MYKLNLKPYKVDNGKGGEADYDVKQSITTILFAPAQQLDGKSLIDTSKVSDKIENAKDEVLLEDSEYNIVKEAFRKFKGLGKTEIELAKRVEEAEQVEVEAKNK